MASRSFHSRRNQTFLIVSAIVIVVSLVAVIWGIRLVIRHGGVQGANLLALYAIAFGSCALIIGLIIFRVFWSRGRASNGDGPDSGERK